ncbi:DUF952 domain-containing protein [Gammaproteobacteria bacterium]|nr:DUF952 domain-containing protein [Gammaproteobacteria bacterium]MDA8998297.1 DUF952 domain-containing protein [Gammaproteobacteria bacterium]MDA9040118.1 DUF952 domain-containing protein [Gammaproteobacteria bacterium]
MIYKVLTLDEWQLAKELGKIVTDIDQEDGFIHLSTSRQLGATLSMYFRSSEQVMLLKINHNKVEKTLKLEPTSTSSSRKGFFYHIYGDLLLEDVSNEWVLERNSFNIPDAILLEAENDNVLL